MRKTDGLLGLAFILAIVALSAKVDAGDPNGPGDRLLEVRYRTCGFNPHHFPQYKLCDEGSNRVFQILVNSGPEFKSALTWIKSQGWQVILITNACVWNPDIPCSDGGNR